MIVYYGLLSFSRLEVFKIWLRDGTISYASDPALIGQRFAVSDQLRQAWAGKVAAEFNHLGDDENAAERAVVVPLLEIYSPIREPWSGEVIAVAEFYEHAEDLEASLIAARLQSWLIVGFVTSAMLAMPVEITTGFPVLATSWINGRSTASKLAIL